MTVARTCNLIFIVLDVLKPLGDKAVSSSLRAEGRSAQMLIVSHPPAHYRSSRTSWKVSVRLLSLCRWLTRALADRLPLPRSLPLPARSLVLSLSLPTGIRINKTPPNITLKKKDKGGIAISHTVPLTKIDTDEVKVRSPCSPCSSSSG